MKSVRTRAAWLRSFWNAKIVYCAGVGIFALTAPASARPVEYVKICSLYGAGFYYMPGTDACSNGNYMPYRVQSEFGTITNGLLPSFGDHAFAYGSHSVAIGNNSWAGGDPTSDSPGPGPSRYGYGGMYPGTAFFNAGSTSLGDSSQAGAGAEGQTNSTAVGFSSLANAKSASAVGANSDAAGNYSTAFGTSSSSAGDYSIATGALSSAAGNNAVAMGYRATATKTGSVAIGSKAASTGDDAIAIGSGASATGSVAVGHNTTASNGGAAYGDFASATGSKSVALGYGASATGANSVAVGAGSVANGANTFSVGSPNNLRRITNVAPGTGPNDVVNFGQYNTGLAATLKQANAHADAGFSDALTQAENYTDQQIGALNGSSGNVRRDAFSGIAAVAALGDGSMPSAPGRTRFSMHTSLFENYTGVGASLSHRFDTEVPLSVDAGFAHAADENLGRVGFSVEF